jgi:hypothetical protein
MKKPPIFTSVVIAAAAAAVFVFILPIRGQQPPGTDAADAKKTAAKQAESRQDSDAQTPDESESTPRKDYRAAKAVLRKSRHTLTSEFVSIKATIRETVAIGNRKITAHGTYLQGANLKLRLEFEIKLGFGKDAITGTLLEVCDGQVLWTRHKIGRKDRITRRDVNEIVKALGRNRDQITSQDVNQILNVAQSRGYNRNSLVGELGLGGLPALLASLEKSMRFNVVRKEQIQGKPYTVIEGSWNAAMMRRFKANSKSKDRLPQHIPDSVRIYFDQYNLPRRILYLKRHPTKNYSRPMVTLDFDNIVLNAPVKDEEFYYVPPDGVPQKDITDAILKQLQSPSAPQSGTR